MQAQPVTNRLAQHYGKIVAAIDYFCQSLDLVIQEFIGARLMGHDQFDWLAPPGQFVQSSGLDAQYRIFDFAAAPAAR